MQEVSLTIQVKTSAAVSPEEVAKIVKRLINIGLDDAAATVEDNDEFEIEEAKLAIGFEIARPVVTKKPRVLVVVNGGIADTICDEGVDVRVFDWDIYRGEEDNARTGVPAHFADLAEPINVPVERA